MYSNELSDELKQTLRKTGVGLWSFDVAAGVFEMDETGRELVGLAPGELPTTETINRRIHPEDLPRYLAEVGEIIKGEERVIDYRVIRPDGSIRFISNRCRLTPGKDGSSRVVTGICIDVSQRRELEEELLATQARMQNLADNVPGLFAYLDRNYVLRFLSAQYDDWYGYSRSRNLNRHIRECIDEEAWAKRKPLYDRCFAGEIVSYEEARTMRDGRERYYTVTYRPATGPGGEIAGILSLAIDITERREAEQRLEEKSIELERSNGDLEQFAYVASHDLKAPLRAIEILVDWLREDLVDFDGGEVKENLALLKQRTGRLHRLLDDLLAYSRAGRKPGDVGDVDTRVLVRDLFVLLSPPAGMNLDADPSLPTLHTFHAPLEQVLRNLVNNAVKHHPGPVGSIRVYAQDKGDEILFAVEDDGTGIPQEFADKVFQMFQTLKPRDEIEGSGMGLAIVKRIVEWQGGRIWFHGGPGGRGTVFKFTWRKQHGATRSRPENDEVTHDRAQDREYLAG